MYFFRCDAPDDPVEYDGERSVVEIIKFISTHRSRTLLEKKAAARAAKQAAAAAADSGADTGAGATVGAEGEREGADAPAAATAAFRGQKMAADQLPSIAGAGGARAGDEAGDTNAALRKLTSP